jgi:hypothetical protein
VRTTKQDFLVLEEIKLYICKNIHEHNYSLLNYIYLLSIISQDFKLNFTLKKDEDNDSDDDKDKVFGVFMFYTLNT